MQSILKYLRIVDEEYHLIEDNDTIVVGVSGGKDSMLLLKALAMYKNFDNKNYRLIAVHLKMGFPNMDTTIIRDYCTHLKVEYYEEETPIHEILKHYLKKDDTLDCSRCSTLKRGAIVNVAKKLKANKIAFAHHGDDAVETFFLNAFYSGNASSFKPKIEYEDKKITFIRPLIYVYEKDIIKAIKNNSIPILKSTCPKDGFSKRQDIKLLMNQIYKDFPPSRKNLLKMISKEKTKTKEE